MDTAATEAKTKMKRSRAPAKPKAERIKAAPLSFREEQTLIGKRAAEKRAALLEEYTEKGYGPVRRTSTRWMGVRTKGLPFSKCVVKNVIPGMQGTRGAIVVQSPTRRRGQHTLPATPENLRLFMPQLPPALTAAMLGVG